MQDRWQFAIYLSHGMRPIPWVFGLLIGRERGGCKEADRELGSRKANACVSQAEHLNGQAVWLHKI